MFCNYKIMKKISLASASLFLITTAFAQNAAAPAAKTAESGMNMLEVLLVIMVAVLAFVIWGLGQVLLGSSRQLMEKTRDAGKILSIALIGYFLMFTQAVHAQTAAAADAVKELPNYGGLSSSTYYLFLMIVCIEVFAIIFLLFSIKRVHNELLPKKELAPGQSSALGEWWADLDKKIFTKAVPVEKEADVLLDHNYDGIRELDNALPPWWKYGFYVTIIVAVIYLMNFHVLGIGKSPAQDYTAEMEKAKVDKDLYDANNKDRVDENNVPMADAAGLARAKEIFTTKCWTCHGKLGEGGAGPNLTDDYWLHKGSLNDIFHTIKTGYPDKGMQSWANEFSPKEISFLASYVKSLHGTNPPNPKAPQGDLYVDSPVAAAKADSAKPSTKDSSIVKKATADTAKAGLKK